MSDLITFVDDAPPPPPPTTYGDAVLADSPSLYWRLGDTSGTTAVDSSGNGHDGSYVGSPVLGTAGLLVGDSDKAAAFETITVSPGSYGRSTAGLATSYPTFTFEAIINLPLNVGFIPLWTFEPDDPTEGGGSGIFYSGDNGFSVQWDTTGLSNYVGNNQGPYTPDGFAHHVVGTYDGSLLQIYFDGASVAGSLFDASGMAFLSSRRMFVGQNPFTNRDVCDPIYMDDVAFYDHALSDTDVANHFAAMTGGGYSAAVLANSPEVYYRLGEPSGSTMADSSGHSHGGVYVNTPTLGTAGSTDDGNTAAIFAILESRARQVVVQNDVVPAGLYPNFSIECIFKATEAMDDSETFLAGLLSGVNTDEMALFLLSPGAAGYVGFGADSPIDGVTLQSEPGSIAVNTTYHIVGTWDDTTLILYINGVNVDSADASGLLVELVTDENFYAANDLFFEQFVGVLDEVAFYLTTLSPERVAVHFAASGLVPAVLSPNVTSISIHSGPISGGTVVDITGTHFSDATAVKFGATNAASFVINSSISITATAPAHVSGLVDVVVTSPEGTSGPSAADHFTFSAVPFVTNVSPNSDDDVGGTPINLTGSQFTGATAVLFGSTSTVDFTVGDDTSITVTSPAHADAIVNIRVVTPSGTSATAAENRFTYGTGGGGVVFDPSAPVVRWTLLDTSDASTATFEMNPGDGGTPGRTRKTSQNRLADGEKVLVYANAEDPSILEFTGTILTQSFYELLLEWFNKTNPVEITDDLGRTFTVMFTKYDATRVWKANVPWFHTYDASAMIVGDLP